MKLGYITCNGIICGVLITCLVKYFKRSLSSYLLEDSQLIRVFLSYSSDDRRIALQIRTELSELGIDVFMAPDDIRGGKHDKQSFPMKSNKEIFFSSCYLKIFIRQNLLTKR